MHIFFKSEPVLLDNKGTLKKKTLGLNGKQEQDPEKLLNHG